MTASDAKVEGGSSAGLIRADDDLARVHLLHLKTVQTDLGLTAGQIGRLEEYLKAHRERSRQYLADVRRIFPDGLPSSPEALMEGKQSQALLQDFMRDTAELQAKLLGMLTPSQSERLKQIQLQSAIGAALSWPEIIKVLGISQEQCAKINAVRDRMWESVNATEWPDLRDVDAQERVKKVVEYYRALDQIAAKASKQMLDALTLEQRTKFEELQGKKIDVTPQYEGVTPEDVDVWDVLYGVRRG